MSLTESQSQQVATLLNERNQLTVQYTSASVAEHAGNYLVHLGARDEVLACVEVKRVQWYQCEVLHLTVAAAQERKGHGKALLCEAEKAARARGARLLQCTIREDNSASRGLFENFGFSQVGTFHNKNSGNNVAIFQKVLANAS